MQRFISGARLWPQGTRKLHVYIVPDLTRDTALHDLVARTRAVLRANFASCLAEVPDPWLHATGRAVAGIAAAEISAEQRAAFARAMAGTLAVVPAFTSVAGPPLATTSSVLLDIDGDHAGGPWAAMSTAIDAVIAEVFGDEALAMDPGAPHLAIAYGTADADSGRIQSLLRKQVRPSRAQLTVEEVHLVDVEQDAAESSYRWSDIARIPLSGGPSRA